MWCFYRQEINRSLINLQDERIQTKHPATDPLLLLKHADLSSLQEKKQHSLYLVTSSSYHLQINQMLAGTGATKDMFLQPEG